jgi:diguanylate cyclase (GGDEF)-like protein
MVDYIRQIETFGITDPLTGLHNRRYFDEKISIEWHRALREKEPLSILFIDIDHFKLFNDTHGHMNGDAALRTVADIFSKTHRRATDIVVRWGGEEFAKLLPNTDSKGASKIAEAIRFGVESIPVVCRDKTKVPITVSIGANTIIPTHEDTVEAFIEAADKALYEAKSGGRNRVCAGCYT